MKHRIIKLVKKIIAAAIFAVLCWKGIELANQQATPPDTLTLAVVVITALGVAYGACVALFQVIKETTGGIMVLAHFLNQHLVEPLKERQREQGREQGIEQGREQGRELGIKQGRELGIKQGQKLGRQTERDRIRTQLREQGLDLDELLPPTDSPPDPDPDQ